MFARPRPAPFAVSLFAHGLILAWVASGPVYEKPKSFTEIASPRSRSKLVWYDFREKLPDVSPTAARRQAQPPRADVKIASQEIVAVSPKAPRARQFVWQPAPKLQLHADLKSPNVLAMHAPRPQPPPPKPKLFVPPPEAPKPNRECARAGGSSGDSYGAKPEGRGQPAGHAAGESSRANLSRADGSRPASPLRLPRRRVAGESAVRAGCSWRRRGSAPRSWRRASSLWDAPARCAGATIARPFRGQHGDSGLNPGDECARARAGRLAQRPVFGRPATAPHRRNGRPGGGRHC